MGTVISTVKSSCLPRVANSSSPARRLVPVTRTWIRYPSFEHASDPNLINSWVAGALDSAWRAVDQYLTINQDTLPPGTRDKFYELWGETEYWDEASDKDLVERNRKLMDRHLVIGLHKSGARIPAK